VREPVENSRKKNIITIEKKINKHIMSGNMGVLPTKERLQKKLQTNFKEIFCKQQIDDTEYGQIYKSPIP